MKILLSAWNKNSRWLFALWPFSFLFRLIVAIRKSIFSVSIRPASFSVPVVVVGNITMGGTGKTPFVISLADYLVEQGFSPGIVSRGYGGNSASYPLMVGTDENPTNSGDEPLLIARRTKCPVVVDPDRASAVKHLISSFDIDIVISDDGLQHYQMYRDIEICMVDGDRLFGNSFCFPAGPLREPIDRIETVDFVVMNGSASNALNSSKPVAKMVMRPKSLVNLLTGEIRPFSGAPFNIGNNLQAVCAIGNPERFYRMLEELPYSLTRFSFPDHYQFKPEDFNNELISEHQPVVMTEKDAIKCSDFATNNFWYIDTEIDISDGFYARVLKRINECKALIASH